MVRNDYKRATVSFIHTPRQEIKRENAPAVYGITYLFKQHHSLYA